MVHLDELPTQNEHPITAELASLKAAVSQFQDESHSSSLKLQRYTLDSARLNERVAQLERENTLLTAELTVLRANPHPESSHQSSSHPAVLQVQQLSLSLRALSDKLTLTEEALLECTNELTNARNEAGKAKHTTDGAYELAAKVRGREENGKLREQELEWKLKEAEEKIKLSDAVLQEYADLVRSLEGRPSIRSPTSASFPKPPSTNGDNGSAHVSLEVPSTSTPATLGQFLAEGKTELHNLVSGFQEQTERLQAELTKAHNEIATLSSLQEAERKAAEADRIELTRVSQELKKLQLDDNTAAKMVSRYMTFSQKSANMLQKAMEALKTRHEATVDTLSSQMVSLSGRLRESEGMVDRLRNSLDELGGDLMKESYGRRREARLRLRLVNREEQIQEGLKRWIRGSEEALRRVEGDERVHEPLLSMVQDAKILLESLDGPVTNTSSLSGSLARMLAMQSIVDSLMEELQAETTRRVKLETQLPVVGGSLTANGTAKAHVEDRDTNAIDWQSTIASPLGVQENGTKIMESHSPPPPPAKDFSQVHSPAHSHFRGQTPLSGSKESFAVPEQKSISTVEATPPLSAVHDSTLDLFAAEAGQLSAQTVATTMIPATPPGGSTSHIEAQASSDVSSFPEISLEPILLETRTTDKVSDCIGLTSSVIIPSYSQGHSEPLDDVPPSTAVQADNISHVDNNPEPLPSPESHSPPATIIQVASDVETFMEDSHSLVDVPTANGIDSCKREGEDGDNEGSAPDLVTSQLLDRTVINDPSPSTAENTKDHPVDILTSNPTTSSHRSATDDISNSIHPSAVDGIQEGSASPQPHAPCESDNNIPSYPSLENLEFKSESHPQIQADSVVIDVYHPQPRPAHDFEDIAKILEGSVASHELQLEVSSEPLVDSASIPNVTVALEVEDSTISVVHTSASESLVETSGDTASVANVTIPLKSEDVSDVHDSAHTSLESSLATVLQHESTTASSFLNLHQADEISPAPEVEAVPKHIPHPLLEELAQVSHRYDDLQQAFRDCHMALEALKKSVLSTETAVSFQTSASKPTQMIGGMSSEILTAVLDRLTDYTENARVELEIKAGDEALLAKGYETLLSIPGALSFNEDEETDLSRPDEVEVEIRMFVEGTDPNIQKAHSSLKQKLDNLQHDIAALKRAIHSPDAEDTASAGGTLSPGKGEGGGGWTSWIRGTPSRPSSPAPGSAASATFGNIMTTPRLRQAPSLIFQSHKKGNDPVSHLGLRVPMPSFAVHAPSSHSPSSPPRSRTVSTMYMLGLGALRSPSGVGAPGAHQRQSSMTGAVYSRADPEATESETDSEDTDIE
ncbi:hypothetical protein BDQ17DRAFT_1358167 [Cyathus striatus]|nr:hypothetical protein BDQ17DRAFT_1358167 [Cyathus striatus]